MPDDDPISAMSGYSLQQRTELVKDICRLITECWFHRHVGSASAEAVCQLIPAILRDEKTRMSRRHVIYQFIKQKPFLREHVEKFLLFDGSTSNYGEEIKRLNRLFEHEMTP
jgi:hypothetical protein